MSIVAKPAIKPGSRLALLLDERGLWVYGNKAGLISLADQLFRIAQADPNDCYECHTRMELSNLFELGEADRGEVSLIVEEQLRDFFSRLPDDAPSDAHPVGFELTFMHIAESGLDDLKEKATDCC